MTQYQISDKSNQFYAEIPRNTPKSSNNSQEYDYHIHQAKYHIIEAVSDLEQNDEVEIHSSDLEGSIYHLPVRKCTNPKEQMKVYCNYTNINH